jgi:hypothetical protein
MSRGLHLVVWNREMAYMAICKSGQAFSIGGFRYLQLHAAVYARILLRRDFCCLNTTELAIHFALDE